MRVGRRRVRRIAYPPGQVVRVSRVGQVALQGGTPQRLSDHLLRAELGTEEPRSAGRNLAALLQVAAATGQGRRGAHELQAIGMQGILHPPHQQCDIGTLPAAVGVQLVQHQEAQPLCSFNQAMLLGTGQDQLQHHIVGEQDVGRVLDDLGLLGIVLLPGVGGEAHRLPAGRVAVAQELLQLAGLTVGQRVHRIDHNRRYSLAPPGS